MFSRLYYRFKVKPKKFYEAAREGGPSGLKIVQKYIHAHKNNPAKLNALDKHHKSALAWASGLGHTDIVTALLKAGAEVNATDHYGRTALYWASFEGHLSIVTLLLQADANVNAADYENIPPLVKAAFKGHLPVITQLLEAGAQVNARGDDGKTALIWAAYMGNEAIIKILLEAHANVYAADREGKTALICAAEQGYQPIVSTLLEARADVDATDAKSKTALISAASMKYYSVVAALLEAHANVDATDSEGQTALICAASNGDSDMVELLLKSKANINAFDKRNKSALVWAARNGHRAIVVNLLKAGAATTGGPLIAAIQGKHTEIAELLIEAKININQVTSKGDTALILAVRHKMKNVVIKLLHAGADTTIKNKRNETAEMLAEGDIDLRELFKDNIARRKLREYIYTLDYESTKRYLSPEIKQSAIQELAMISLHAISENILFLKAHLYQVTDFNPIGAVIHEFSTLLMALGSGCDEENKKFFDDTANRVIEISSKLGYELSKNIIEQFERRTEAEEKKSDLGVEQRPQRNPEPSHLLPREVQDFGTRRFNFEHDLLIEPISLARFGQFGSSNSRQNLSPSVISSGRSEEDYKSLSP